MANHLSGSFEYLAVTCLLVSISIWWLEHKTTLPTNWIKQWFPTTNWISQHLSNNLILSSYSWNFLASILREIQLGFAKCLNCLNVLSNFCTKCRDGSCLLTINNKNPHTQQLQYKVVCDVTKGYLPVLKKHEIEIILTS